MIRKNLIKRLIFAAWAIPLGWFVVNSDFSLLPPVIAEYLFSNTGRFIYPGHICTLVLVFIACSEYISMLSHFYPKNGFGLVYLWLAFQFVSYFIPVIAVRSQLDTYILLIIVAAESIIWGKRTGRWKRASLLFSGTIFLSIAGLSTLNFYHGSLQSIFPRRYSSSMLSQLGIVTICTSVFLCDSAAYFIGNFWGKHHFSSISPKKTVEGSIAGLIAAIIASSLGWYFFAETSRYPWILGLVMGIIIGIFAQLGDLLVSLIKRYFKVKDASNIIPGHGGILDRFDSVFFTAPILNLLFILITRIAG